MPCRATSWFLGGSSSRPPNPPAMDRINKVAGTITCSRCGRTVRLLPEHDKHELAWLKKLHKRVCRPGRTTPEETQPEIPPAEVPLPQQVSASARCEICGRTDGKTKGTRLVR